MNFFPKPPTDNLYKFLAITGTWLVAIVTAFFMYLGYLTFELKKLNYEQSRMMFSESVVREIDRRLKSISEDKLDENILDWTPRSEGSDEVQFITQIKQSHLQRVKDYDSKPKPDYGYQFDLVKETGFINIVYGIIFLAVSCFYFGFRGWYSKIQKPMDLGLKLDLKIKEVSIEKMEAELALTKKSIRTHSIRRLTRR
ncbi:hypothetical protein [Shewanella sp. Arc9-LZ]|uniref:hypothetical protein n=1 Tax=Shewanella sp. Arc9-LZ TaxID=2698686 RepID=UPI00137BF39A|nr:hypothetical protein [Shewanella sp. Arc9-LZ]QHS13189.1 hypothetical protein GUY17_08730 [Shewanella sp. Arc9-LZ]